MARGRSGETSSARQSRKECSISMKAEEYHKDLQEIFGLKVSITSYKIGSQYYCHVDNVDPGATIARTEAESKEAAIAEALAKAHERLTPKKH